MKKMTPEAVYSQLRDALCKKKSIPDADWDAFIEKTRIDLFEENKVAVEPGQLSTRSYFIIKGLMMCYIPREPKNAIMWFRAENEHAFTIDMLNDPLRKIKGPKVNEERLIALEDTIVVSISHEDMTALQESNQNILTMLHDCFTKMLVKFNALSKRTMKDPEHDYEWMQRYISFDPDRIPIAYLATYLGTSVKKLKEMRKALQP